MSERREKGISRRTLLKAAATAALAVGAGASPRPSQASTGAYATLIDISLCDGCPDRDTPACVEACRLKNAGCVPEPVDPIPQVFPRGQIEDFSKKRHLTDRLTPYN